MWPDWLKAIQLKPRYLFAIFVIGLSILLLPSRVTETFGLTAIRENYRQWVGLTTLAAFVFWCVQLIPYFKARRRLRKLKDSQNEREEKRKSKKVTALEERRAYTLRQIETLSEKEMLILAYCLYKKHRTLTLPLTDSAANALCQKGLLEMIPGAGMPSEWPFTIPEFVWEELKRHEDEILPRNELPNIRRVFEEFEHYKNRMF